MQRVLNVVLVGSIFLLLFLGYFHTITAITQDLGRHILTGKIIVDTHNVPKENLFSYTYPHFLFINHHWFSEVIFYLVYLFSGFTGLLVLTVMSILTSFCVLFYYLRKHASIFAIVVSCLLYFPILFERTDVRPEIFSFFFLAFFIVILYRFRETYTRWIFLLLPLELLWVNMHIYFPIGIFLIGLFLMDEVIHQVWKTTQVGYPPRPIGHSSYGGDKTPSPLGRGPWQRGVGKSAWDNKKLFVLVLMFCSCSLITLFNPNGFSGATYPLRVFQNYGYSIEENQNVFFLQQIFPHESIQYFFITVFLLFLFLLITVKKSKPIDWLLALFFTYLGASAIRNFPLFVFGTMLIFSGSISILLEKIVDAASKRYTKKIVTLAALVLLLLVIMQSVQVVKQHDFGFGLVSGASGGVDFLLQNKLPGPLFNNFDIGSYLEYRLYAEGLPAGRQVFVDGRPEAYPQRFFQHVYIPMQQDPNKFMQVAEKYHFNTIFFSYIDQTPWAAAFVASIMQNKAWKLVYLDDVIMILVKQNVTNAAVIKKFGMDQEHVHISHFESITTKNLINLAYFFDTVGWSNQEIPLYKTMLQKDENNCTALYNLSVLYQKENNPAKDSYTLQAQTRCPQMFTQQ